jgi:hypothetical protein
MIKAYFKGDYYLAGKFNNSFHTEKSFRRKKIYVVVFQVYNGILPPESEQKLAKLSKKKYSLCIIEGTPTESFELCSKKYNELSAKYNKIKFISWNIAPSQYHNVWLHKIVADPTTIHKDYYSQ